MMLLTYVVVLVLMIISNANGLFQFPSSNKRATLISNILKLADITERGLIETSEQNLQMKKLFEQLGTIIIMLSSSLLSSYYHHYYHFHLYYYLSRETKSK